MTNSPKKGKEGECEVAHLFEKWFPGCRRSFGQSRCGYEQPDIIGGGIGKEFYIEVKLWSRRTYRPGKLTGAWDKNITDQVKHLHLVGDDSDERLALPLLVFRVTDRSRKNVSVWQVGQWYVAYYYRSFASLKPYMMLTGFVAVVKWEDFAELLDRDYT